MELMERYSFFTFWERLPGAVHATWSEAEARFGDSLMPLAEVIAACHDRISPVEARRVMNLRRWIFLPATLLPGRGGQAEIRYLPLDLFKLLGEFNGSSAGNTDVESLLQGGCELVERHVCCLADRSGMELPTIRSEGPSVRDPVLSDLLDKFRANGVEVLLKDFSLGMPVPTVAALAHDPATFPERSEIVFTAGTASSPVKAAVRALTEVAQLAGDFNSDACYEASGLPKYGRIEESAWLRAGPPVDLESLPSVEDDDILNELLALAGGLRKKGHPLYALATTHPDVGVPAHYSVAPGLGFRERDANASLGLFTGRILCERGDEKEAAAALAELGKIYPGAHFLPFFQGMLALRAGQTGRAETWFTKAEDLQPDDDSRALAAFYAAHARALSEEWAAALPGFERASRLCPDMKEYKNRLGVCLFKLGLYEEAAREFADILGRLDRGSATDIQNLGLCHKFMGHDDEARHFLVTALEMDPSLDAARKHLDELNARA
jgi:ribosomal protein S12 methylthiotransferase accessory factor